MPTLSFSGVKNQGNKLCRYSARLPGQVPESAFGNRLLGFPTEVLTMACLASGHRRWVLPNAATWQDGGHQCQSGSFDISRC